MIGTLLIISSITTNALIPIRSCLIPYIQKYIITKVKECALFASLIAYYISNSFKQEKLINGCPKTTKVVINIRCLFVNVCKVHQSLK